MKTTERLKASQILTASDRREEETATPRGSPAKLSPAFERKRKENDTFGFWAFAITTNNTLATLSPEPGYC